MIIKELNRSEYKGISFTEHNVNLIQLSLVSVFSILDLDFLVSARCAQEQSWTNPVKQVMSVFNIGLQNVSSKRKAGPEKGNTILKHGFSIALNLGTFHFGPLTLF